MKEAERSVASGGAPAPSRLTVSFDSLPTPALLVRLDTVVAVNAAYERFIGLPADAVVGRTVLDLIGQFVRPGDAPLAGAAANAYIAGQGDAGALWLRVIDGSGRVRPVRVDWTPSADGEENVVYLVDAEGEAAARAAAEGLARAAGELGQCRDEHEILERAADILYARGLVVTTLLLREGEPLLAYGPMRHLPQDAPTTESRSDLLSSPPRREVLWAFNKDFDERKAAFFQDVGPLIAAAYPGGVGARVDARISERTHRAGSALRQRRRLRAIVLTGDSLNPALVGSIEMFAELVARAIENIRLRTELLQRGRLAALGEAAAVMAHEVRNPISAILNAVTLLQKDVHGPATQSSLLRVIGEEAHRLERLVMNLLDLGRPLTPHLKSVDLHELAELSVGVLGARGETCDVEVVVERPEVRVLASIDPEPGAARPVERGTQRGTSFSAGTRVHVAAVSRGEERRARGRRRRPRVRTGASRTDPRALLHDTRDGHGHRARGRTARRRGMPGDDRDWPKPQRRGSLTMVFPRP